MAAVLVVNSESEISRLMPWAWQIAKSSDLELEVVIAQVRDGNREWTEVDLKEGKSEGPEIPALLETLQRLARIDKTGGNESPGESGDVVVRRLRDPAPDRALVEELRANNSELLILPLDGPIKDSAKTWTGRLYRGADCEAIYLRVPANAPAEFKRILVPTAGDPNANAAVKRADTLAKHSEGEVTALFVTPDFDAYSSDVGQRKLGRYVRRAIGKDASRIRPVAVVGDDFLAGLREQLCETYDLVLVGAYRDRTIKRVFFGSVSKEVFEGPDAPAFAAVRAAIPFRTRFQQFVERQVQTYVPQLDREQRVSLVDRVHSSSQWDFDFIALICLSTCIAAMGLTQNQAPVVIGAMLVAPLMTPLVGAGLALVQGNGALIKSALRSVLFGFCLAALIGVGIGFLTLRNGTLPAEILARTKPGLVDLAVAFVGGVAAAYAMSRPNLSSALPGVAIAAALVPPIASAGITLSRREFQLSKGACLLFLTNIVAIILGTAVSLWMVGIRDTHVHGSKQKWSSWFAALLLTSVVVLGFAISHKATPDPGVSPVDQLTSNMQQDIEAFSGVRLVSITPDPATHIVDVVVESPTDELQSLAEALQTRAVEHFDDPEVVVKLEVRHVLSASSKSAK
ncbi:MAG: DUF389 domain-containing protein [Planctomycetota bacterium]